VFVGLAGEMDGVQLARALRDAHCTNCRFLTASPERALAGRDTAVGCIGKPHPTALVVRVVQALGAAATGEERPTRPGSVHWFA
jgi:DNA-binding LytR/AlgR family response regulator